MVKKRGRPRVTGQQITDMVRLHRQGWSISAIARSVGCHRQTVRGHLTERQADVLAEEVRKQALTEDLQKHLDDLTQFAVSFKSYLTTPDMPTEDRDATAVLTPLLPKALLQGLDSVSQKTRREQRQKDRQTNMLLRSLREHTGEKGWWQAFEEWREVWDICIEGLKGVREQAPKVVGNYLSKAPEVVGNYLSQKAEEKVGEKSGKEYILDSIVYGVLWAAWCIVTASEPEEELELRNFRVVPEGQRLRIRTGGYYLNLIFDETETALAQEVAAVCNNALQDLYPRYMVDEILGMLQRMDEKIEVIDDALDPFILRPLLVRTRCTLCPV